MGCGGAVFLKGLFRHILLVLLYNATIPGLMKNTFLALLLVLLAAPAGLFAQDNDKAAVTYEQIYDEPYAVNKLFVALQPLYGEMFVAKGCQLGQMGDAQNLTV